MSDTAQKVNKLASAVYLVTSFFSDREPLKWKLRDLSAHLVSSSLSFKSYLFDERDYAGLENRQTILEINSLLAVAKNVGLVSEANFNLLSQEFSKYLEFIGFPAGLEERDGRGVLSEKFFATHQKEAQLPPKESENPIKDKNIEQPQNRSLSAGYLPSIRPHSSHSESKPRLENTEKPLKQFGAVSVKKNSRQSVIISLLKRKKEIMIKDVSPLISGCSEKTIQRELSAMVAAGILKKIGEKRWSRYTLVQSD